MKYLGIMKQEDGQVTMPDTFQSIELQQSYEVVEVCGDLLLLPSPLIVNVLHGLNDSPNSQLRSTAKHWRDLPGELV